MHALVIEVRLLDQRFHGVPDWPPSPGRLFQALVSGASVEPERPGDKTEALLWLEHQDAPIILSPRMEEMRGYTSYVPNNDGDAETDPTNPSRIGKQIRGRLLSDEAPLVYLWSDLENIPDAVTDLAAGLFQLGRGIDPAFARARIIYAGSAETLIMTYPGRVHRPAGQGADGLDCPMPGSLDSLDGRHTAFLNRLASTGSGRRAAVAFANPPRARFRRIRYDCPATCVVFDLTAKNGGFRAMDAAGAGPLVTDWLKDAAERLGPALTPLAERFLTGKTAGPRDIARRVRAFALPTIRRQGDRCIRRLAVEIPPDCPIRRDDLIWALGGSDAFAVKWGIPVLSEDHRMLGRYCGPARVWQSETALALPIRRRRLEPGRDRKTGTERAGEEAGARAAVADALRHAGISTRVVSIDVRREPFADHGTRAEAFAEGMRFSKHRLWHVGVGFAEPVRGPLILGNGRFVGLGLMRPAASDTSEDVISFRIVAGLAEARTTALAHAFRRAVLARMGDAAPAFVTGHEEDGTPKRPGHHDHVAYVADLARCRLMVIPPHLFHRNPELAPQPQQLGRLRDALQGMSMLLAGSAGRLSLRPDPVGDDDPLFAPASVWESATPYYATRHPKGGTAEQSLVADVQRDLCRHGLPRAEIEVLEARLGPRGALSGRVRLTFAHSVEGPILLGRTLHKGGGLFAAADIPKA